MVIAPPTSRGLLSSDRSSDTGGHLCWLESFKPGIDAEECLGEAALLRFCCSVNSFGSYFFCSGIIMFINSLTLLCLLYFTIINYRLIIIIFVFVCLERYKLYHVRYEFKLGTVPNIFRMTKVSGSCASWRPSRFCPTIFPCGLINLSYNMSQALRFCMYICIHI